MPKIVNLFLRKPLAMRYIDISENGGPEAMVIKEGEPPDPGKSEVLIKVYAEDKARIAEKIQAQIWPLIENGEIKPLIAAHFPLADAAEAHKLMESSKHIGNIILTVID